MARKKQAQPEVINEELQEQNEGLGYTPPPLYDETIETEWLINTRKYLQDNEFPNVFILSVEEFDARKGALKDYIVTYDVKGRPICYDMEFKKVKTSDGDDYAVRANIYSFNKTRAYIPLRTLQYTYTRFRQSGCQEKSFLCVLDEEVKLLARVIKF